MGWDGKKIRKNGRAKSTYDAVYTLGMRNGNSGNLRHVARRLGVKEFEDLSSIREALVMWADAPLSTATTELERLFAPALAKSTSRASNSA